jgi:cell division protease FtsH
MNLPETDRLSIRRNEIEAKLAMTFGGRVAEQLIYGDDNVTTGAGNDIQQATRLARAMVTEYGMSDKLGPLRYSDNEEEIFLGHSVTQRKNVSDATARIIDEEVRRIIEEAESKAREVLTEHLDDLKGITEALLEYETLSGDEVRQLLKGEAIERPETSEPPEDTSGTSSVPSSAKGRHRDDSDGGMEPEPQPGS